VTQGLFQFLPGHADRGGDGTEGLAVFAASAGVVEDFLTQRDSDGLHGSILPSLKGRDFVS